MRKIHIAMIVSIVALSLSLFANVVAVNNNTAVCKYRADLQARYDAGREFVKKHPNGIPGISRSDLDRSLKVQAATLKSLENLRCFTS